MSYVIIRRRPIEPTPGFHVGEPTNAADTMAALAKDVNDPTYQTLLFKMLPPAYMPMNLGDKVKTILRKAAPLIPESRMQELFSALHHIAQEKPEALDELRKKPEIANIMLEAAKVLHTCAERYRGAPIAVMAPADELTVPEGWETRRVGDRIIYTKGSLVQEQLDALINMVEMQQAAIQKAEAAEKKVKAAIKQAKEEKKVNSQ